MEYVDGEDLGGAASHRPPARRQGDRESHASCARGSRRRTPKRAAPRPPEAGQYHDRRARAGPDHGLRSSRRGDQVGGAEVRNGTPAYMARNSSPTRSDERATFSRSAWSSTRFSPASARSRRDRSIVHSVAACARFGLRVERVIPAASTRSGDASAVRARAGADAARRRSARGGWPPRYAVAGMVAASEDTGALSVRGTVACLTFVVTGLIALSALSAKSGVVRLTPVPFSHDVLARSPGARGAPRLPDPPADSYKRLSSGSIIRSGREESDAGAVSRAGPPRPAGAPAVSSIARARTYIVPRQSSGRPAKTIRRSMSPAWCAWRWDPQGPPHALSAVPPQWMPAIAGLTRELEHDVRRRRAGISRTGRKPRRRKSRPLVSMRARPDRHLRARPTLPMRIEAASWKGPARVVRAFGPWRQPVWFGRRLPHQSF